MGRTSPNEVAPRQLTDVLANGWAVTSSGRHSQFSLRRRITIGGALRESLSMLLLMRDRER